MIQNFIKSCSLCWSFPEQFGVVMVYLNCSWKEMCADNSTETQIEMINAEKAIKTMIIIRGSFKKFPDWADI